MSGLLTWEQYGGNFHKCLLVCWRLGYLLASAFVFTLHVYIYIYIYIYETRVGFAKVCRINENTNNWHRANKIGQPANQPVSQPGTHHSASQPAASRPAQPSPAQLHAAQPPAQPSPAQATLASQPDLRRPACCQRSPSLHLLRWTSFFSTCRTCMQEVHHPGRLQCRQSGTVQEEPQKLPAKPPASHASQ
jgi:hypothetical protein